MNHFIEEVSKLHYCWNWFGIEYEVWDIFLCNFFSCCEKLEITKFFTREKFWPYKILTRKNFEPTKYSRKKTLDPQKTHEKNFLTRVIHSKARWHDGIKPTRTTMTRNPRSLAHSTLKILSCSICRSSVTQQQNKEICT